MVSTIDHFAESVQTQYEGIYSVGLFMYDENRTDSVLCFSTTCYNDNNNAYTSIREQQGLSYGMTTNRADFDVLYVWYSSKYQKNFVANSSTIPPADGNYSLSINNNGYILKSNKNYPNGTLLALDLYYNENLRDYATVATDSLKSFLKSKNYSYISTQGYIMNYQSNLTSNGVGDWQMGIANSYFYLHNNFSHETTIVEAQGINNAMLNQFGSRLQTKYNTTRVTGDDDIITSYLGYWTDNGAYYYGDDWANGVSDPQNLTCCNPDVFIKVKKALDDISIPIRYWQMDDWWYNGTKSGSDIQWGGVRAVTEWKPPSKYYPGGLKAFGNEINLPFLLYAPYFSPVNQWSKQFEFTPDVKPGTAGAYVLPTPEDSYAFYSRLYEFGINSTTTEDNPNTGMISYEVDFMSSLTDTPVFRLYTDAEKKWMNGMNLAAVDKNLIVQICMAAPAEIMETLTMKAITNSRTSKDYAYKTNWNIGATSILHASMKIKPSKDNFWTTFPQPHTSAYHPHGNDQASVETHCIIAIMSCGPVGISDSYNRTNKTLIMRTTREDGRLLQPNRPMTAITDQFLHSSFIDTSSGLINVWSTESGFRNNDHEWNVTNIYQIILAVDMRINYSLRYNSFEVITNGNANGINGKSNDINGLIISNKNNYILRNWHSYGNCKNGTYAIKSGCVKYAAGQESMMDILYTFDIKTPIQPSNESFELVLMTEAASFDDIVFLGELDKYVSVSEHRFSDLMIQGRTMKVGVRGTPDEVVHVSMLYPMQTNVTDWVVMTKDVVIPSNGSTILTVT